MKVSNIIISVVYICMMFVSYQSRAEEGPDFVFEAATSSKSIKFTITDGATGSPETFPADLITLDYAVALLYRDFYARLKLSQSIKDDVLLGEDVLFMSRSDIDFTVGYYIGSGFSAFAGYKRGEFDVNIVAGNASLDPNMRVRFIDSGPFVGVNYKIDLAKSSLSFVIAYAEMDGEIDVTVPGLRASTTGDTTGVSYTVSWSLPVTESTNLVTALNIIRYKFDDKEIGLGSYLNTEQEFDNISVGLVHYF